MSRQMNQPSGVRDDLSSHLIAHINVKLALIGCPPVAIDGNTEFAQIVSAMAGQSREKDRLLGNYLSPVDQRIQTYLFDYLQDVPAPKLPTRTFTLDRPGLARVLSLPFDRDEFHSEIISSYRVANGVLHNPKSDRRTTHGIFHVTEGGLPIPDDKLGVPRATFAKMLAIALNPPRELMRLPFTATQKEPAECFVSLLLRPLVCPEVLGFTTEKRLEVRFFVPGNLVSNLDFVENIFGNAGDPLLPENDAALDVEHWTGHTGCVILAPHLVGATKKSVGLPHFDKATERQRRDGMCYSDEKELYNDGGAFKLTCRNESGVIVTLIADNYFGYCKKEVKTQISFAANLLGNVEEEHAGGAVAYMSYNFGDEYQFDSRRVNGRSFADVVRDYGHLMDVKPEGYAVDKKFPSLLYVPEDSRASARKQEVWWTDASGKEQRIPMMPGMIYMTPSGFKLLIEKHPGAPSWRIIGTRGEGASCHKPCTVSGGGK